MADEYGYVKISRKAYETDLFWNERRVFSRWEAWEDLIQMAAWRPYRKIVKGELVSLGRGQLLASERFLAERWRWSRGKVRRFFELLVEMGRIEISDQYTDHIGRVVTLLNYDKYQSGGPVEGPETEPAADQSRTSDGPPADQREGNKAERNTSSTPSPSLPRAHTRAEDLDRLRAYLGEHAGAVDRFAAAAEHSPTWPAAILGLYGPQGTDPTIWQRSPPEVRPALLARALDRYAGESRPYHGKLFRSFLEAVINEHTSSGRAAGGDRGRPAPQNGRSPAQARAPAVAPAGGDPSRRSRWVYE